MIKTYKASLFEWHDKWIHNNSMRTSPAPGILSLLIFISGCAGMKPAAVLKTDKTQDPVQFNLDYVNYKK